MKIDLFICSNDWTTTKWKNLSLSLFFAFSEIANMQSRMHFNLRKVAFCHLFPSPGVFSFVFYFIICLTTAMAKILHDILCCRYNMQAELKHTYRHRIGNAHIFLILYWKSFQFQADLNQANYVCIELSVSYFIIEIFILRNKMSIQSRANNKNVIREQKTLKRIQHAHIHLFRLFSFLLLHSK